MRRVLVIGGIAALVAILAVAALGAVALAQEGEDGPFNFRAKFNEAVAGLLGIPVSDYEQALTDAREQVLDEAVDEGWLTEEQREKMQERMQDGAGPGRMGPHGMFPGKEIPEGDFPEGGFHGRGWRGMPFGWKGAPEGGPLAAAAEALGMSVEDLLSAMQEGQSIAGLAVEKGVELDTIADAYVTPMEEKLAELVEEGELTQEQADQKLESLREMIRGMLEKTWPEGGFHDFRKGGHPGRFEDLPGQNDA